jgi:prolipoprotein diacylglyceryl transferase
MPLASLPGPFSGQWHVGPLPVHGYALCLVLGVLAALWVAERRYRAVGGRPWLIVDIATVAVPAGLLGARLYRVVTDPQQYFGHGHDWVNILRIWDSGIGLPGAAVAGLAAALLWCRRTKTGVGPVLCAAVPGLAFGQAVAVLGNWFAQSMYGPPTSMPWAVAIAPRFRVPGYQDYGTFQPLFLYESVWDVIVAIAMIRLIRVQRLTGGRALALCAGLYAAGRMVTTALLLTGTQHGAVIGEQIIGAAVLVAAAAYLYVTRYRKGPEALTVIAWRRPLPRSAAPAAMVRPIQVEPRADFPESAAESIDAPDPAGPEPSGTGWAAAASIDAPDPAAASIGAPDPAAESAGHLDAEQAG